MSDITIPVLETDRLILRAPRLDDLPLEAAFLASQRARFVGGPMSGEMAWRGFAAVIGHWALRGFGRWAVEVKATGQYAGLVGLWYPGGWPEPEIGWQIQPEAEGRGIAHEAALKARAHAYRTLGWSTAISMIDLDNSRSIALAEKMGARFEANFTHERFGKTGIWRHPSPETLTEGQAA